MPLFPDITEFRETYDAGKAQLVWTVIPTDLETPVSAMLKLMPVSPYHLLYESVEGGKTRARYSIIALDPDLLWRCVEGRAELCRDVTSQEFERQEGDVFDALRALLDESHIEVPQSLPPMASGLFGFMGYDMVRHMERLPDKNPDVIGLPDAIYMRPKITVIFDSVKDEATIITPVWVRGVGHSVELAYKEAEGRIAHICDMLNSAVTHKSGYGEKPELNFTSHLSREEYYAMVEKAKDYILAGDIFQVVPSRRLSTPFAAEPFSLYRSLRHLNPSPYLFYLSFAGLALVGSSPETLVRLQDGVVTIRPIAGTRPRGKNEEGDQALEKDLLSDRKELAEHLMLLDLGRNDVGRVAKTGTVNVTAKMTIERYSHVMHIVSNVEGVIREDRDAVDALIAGFPAGTVTGAPKIRAMEIIDELEKERRGFYSGTVGYFSCGGGMDTCIALRTGLVKDNTLYIQAGGGVVADSDREAEFQETENKAGALMSAAKEAYKYV